MTAPTDLDDLADTITHDLLEHLRTRAWWSSYDGCAIEDATADPAVLLDPSGQRIQVAITVTLTPADATGPVTTGGTA